MTGEQEEIPIVEAFGYHVGSDTPEAREAWQARHCRFTGTACEKFRQYGYGYCSVRYATKWDDRTRRTYAVCDHRLDGAPLAAAVRDHFGDRGDQALLVPEIVVDAPRASFDFAAITSAGSEIEDIIAIETHSIDIRGGSVAPAWQAWEAGEPERWREYFSQAAAARGRDDKVSFGVNMANVYKRLAVQIANKGRYLRDIGVPFYVVMQDEPYRYLRDRVDFEELPGGRWDITFMSWRYPDGPDRHGRLDLEHVTTARTTLDRYQRALEAGKQSEWKDREHFLTRVKLKAGL